MKFKFVVAAAMVALLTGCAGGPESLGNGRYVVAAQSMWAGTTGEGQIGDAVKKANQFCAKKGKEAVVENLNTTRGGFQTAGAASVIFTCK